MTDASEKLIGAIKLGVIAYKDKLMIVNTEAPGVKAYHYLWDHCHEPLSASGVKYLSELLQDPNCDALKFLQQNLTYSGRNLTKLDIEIIARLTEIRFYGEYEDDTEDIVIGGSRNVYNDYPDFRPI